MVAETTGLVGAWLRRSPGIVLSSMYLDVQGVRAWLGTTPQPIHQGTTVLHGRRRLPDARTRCSRHILRPLAAGADSVGPSACGRLHLPAGARSAPWCSARSSPASSPSSGSAALLHLLGDDRGAAGAGQSAFRRGLCWSGPDHAGERRVNLLVGALSMGFLLSLLTLGVFITYRVMGRLDLTTDGSFGLGGAVAAALLARPACIRSSPPWPRPPPGGWPAPTTGLIYVVLGIDTLLAGILVTTALYTVQL